jgi:tetratricopeptide (TPR) repeat protein
MALAQRRPDDAKRAFTEVLRLNPRAADAQVELSRLHLAEGAVEASMTLAGQASRNDASNLEAKLLLARGFVAQREFDKARTALEQLAAEYPKSASVRAQLGYVLALKKDVAGATARFDEALGLDPDNLEAIGGLISLDLATRQHAKARERIVARVARTPNSSSVLLLAGRTYAVLGDKAAAEQAIRQAIQTDPSNLAAYEALGTFYVRSNRLDEALREFEGLAAKQDRPVASLTMVAMIHQMRNRSQDARATYERILQVDPTAAVAANNLAWMYAETGGNLDVALQLAKTAKAKLPKSPEVSDTLGWIYYRKGLFSLAIVELEESVTRSPSNPLFQFHLGMTYAKNGDRDRARKALETALRLKSDFEGAGEARSLLASL